LIENLKRSEVRLRITSRVTVRGPKLARWRITRIRSTPAVEIGTVQAPDAASAIDEAIRRYDIRQPWQRERLVARRIR
jgi:hypothetical protein